MNRFHILVAEDDEHIRAGLVDTLESEGYRVSAVRDGAEAIKRISASDFDLILLDVMMPQMSGYDVCREARRKGQRVPIIMLTAKGEEMDKVIGLELGADDYVTKPFGIRELLARVAAVLRRSQEPVKPSTGNLPNPFRFGKAVVDRKKFAGCLGKRRFDLTARELKLLEVFAAHPGEVLSRNDLLNAAWGVDYLGTTRTLDQHIVQLRKKIESDPGNPTVITTVHGVGYRYEAP